MAANDVVLCADLPTAGGRRFGVATLNAPAALNALSLQMVRALSPALRAWAADPAVAGVILQGAGDKAFCAGGDLRELYQSIRAHGSAPNPYAASFFGEEYALDYAIHTFPKPLLCWGHGIVMGGGIGLMAGASHRVVTEKSRLAMPEVGIGLYPDVGGSAILRRMPGRVGLFLALTGASLDAADALFCGLADHVLRADSRAAVLAAIGAATWSDDAAANATQLTQLLAPFAASATTESKVRRHVDVIDALVDGDDLRAIEARLRALTSDDAWLATAAATYAQGSPTSAALAFALWQRAPQLSLPQVFQLEYQVSLGCCAHADFPEGIRALLVDKDRQPRWNPATLAAVTPALVADHFRPRVVLEAAHPLAALDRTIA